MFRMETSAATRLATEANAFANITNGSTIAPGLHIGRLDTPTGTRKSNRLPLNAKRGTRQWERRLKPNGTGAHGGQ